MMTPGFTPSPDVKVAAMVARHGDAELIGAAMAHFGVELIRGAGAGGRRKDRGGAHALRQAVRTLHDGATVVMTADVPPGPARRPGIGIVTLARLSGRPIVPVASATSRFLALDTWSRMTINLPFSKLAYVAGDPDQGRGRRRRGRDGGGARRARAVAERRDRPRLRSSPAPTSRARRRLRPGDPDAPPAEPDFAAQDLPRRHEPAAAAGADRPEGARAQRQGRPAPARRAARPGERRAARRACSRGCTRQASARPTPCCP